MKIVCKSASSQLGGHEMTGEGRRQRAEEGRTRGKKRDGRRGLEGFRGVLEGFRGAEGAPDGGRGTERGGGEERALEAQGWPLELLESAAFFYPTWM